MSVLASLAVHALLGYAMAGVWLMGVHARGLVDAIREDKGYVPMSTLLISVAINILIWPSLFRSDDDDDGDKHILFSGD